MTTNSMTYEREVKRILDELNDELYRGITSLKKDTVLKGAKLLENLGLPKKSICAELVDGLRGVSKSLIYKTLGPEYSLDYRISTSTQFEEKEVIEEDAKKVAAKYDIDVNEEQPSQAIYFKILEKLKIATDQGNSRSGIKPNTKKLKSC